MADGIGYRRECARIECVRCLAWQCPNGEEARLSQWHDIIAQARTLVSISVRHHLEQHTEAFSHAFDLWSVIPYIAMDEETRKVVWDDGLHLTAEGYKRLGDAVAMQLFEILRSKSKA